MSHASYTLDSRIEALLAEVAKLLLEGLLARAEPADFAQALAHLEGLQVAAWYLEAGIPHDDEPLSPTGRRYARRARARPAQDTRAARYNRRLIRRSEPKHRCPEQQTFATRAPPSPAR